MFFDFQTKAERERYKQLLEMTTALSRCFSERSTAPYLHYRMAENIFCRVFNAENMSRSDIAIDAVKAYDGGKRCGIGLKTFLHRNGCCFEKVAEFDRERSLYATMSRREDSVAKIAELRNKRIVSACGACSVSAENLIYHCVTRADVVLHLHEEPMRLMNLENIRIREPKEEGNIISFTDGTDEYRFNFSKCTLFKQFRINKPIASIPVRVLEDPFGWLERYLSNVLWEADGKGSECDKAVDAVVLPLYSYKGRDEKYVPVKSGLNQWNAGGRRRGSNEAYIPVPAGIHEHKPDFFPPRDESFLIKFPDGTFKSAKICQDGGKALMTNPNEVLGKGLLRDVLKIAERKPVTYEMLKTIGIDAVRVTKIKDGNYEMDFMKTDSYEDWKRSEGIF